MKAVIFDVGGVLLLPSGTRLAEALGAVTGLDLETTACRDGWTRTLAEIEVDMYTGGEWKDESQAALARFRGSPTDPSVFEERWLQHAGVPDELLAEAAVALRAVNRQPRSLWSDHVPGGHAVLKELASSEIRLGCISNSDGRVEQELREDGFADFFEVVIDSHVVGVAKPDPRIFELCLASMPGARGG